MLIKINVNNCNVASYILFINIVDVTPKTSLEKILDLPLQNFIFGARLAGYVQDLVQDLARKILARYACRFLDRCFILGNHGSLP